MLVQCYLEAFGCTGFIQNKDVFVLALFIELLIESPAVPFIINYFDKN